MADIVLDTDELTVLGGPSSIDVNIGVGPAGRRGVYIFANANEPDENGELPPSAFYIPPVVNDLYILINPASDNYLVMYQYLNQDGVLRWVDVIKLTPNLYDTARVVNFVGGVGEAQINIFNLGFGKNIPLPPLLNSRFLFGVQATPDNPLPVALSITVEDLVSIAVDDVEVPGGIITYLPITLTAAELNPVTGWQALNRQMVVNLSLALKNPNDLLEGLIDEGS
jgi:hypothetical protein